MEKSKKSFNCHWVIDLQKLNKSCKILIIKKIFLEINSKNKII
jgi:hypothetical protein